MFGADLDEESVNNANNLMSYYDKRINSGELVATAKPDARSIRLENLEEWTEYQFRVLAANKVGDGPASDPIFLRTDEAGMFNLSDHDTNRLMLIHSNPCIAVLSQSYLLGLLILTY